MVRDQQTIIQQTVDYVKERLSGEGSGHDWWHVYRVWQSAKRIAQEEQADLFVVELAALLHDIADYKFHGGDEEVGPRVAREWLASLTVAEEVSVRVGEIIRTMSFKGAEVEVTAMATPEGQAVQDADRLDAMGALGIARAFAYGGYRGREMYNPEVKPELHDSAEAYKGNAGPTVNHFYEKLLLLKDRMSTATGKSMAEERHRFMLDYLDRFYAEWDGKI